MRLAVTADLHWGLNPAGDAATRELARSVVDLAPDAFAIAGDVGEGESFHRCLELFGRLRCPRLVVPGNHDLWTREPDSSSLERYQHVLRGEASVAGFHYLDQHPVRSVDGRVGIVGSINWYDYSFADPAVADEYPEAPEMYRAKLFPNGQHNDGRFVRLRMSDADFTAEVVSRFTAHLAELPSSVEQVVVIQHHPPVRELFYPTPLTNTYQRFWLAYTGNRRMQEAVLSEPRVQTVICGHTHAFCTADVEGKRCINIGGDYDFKRLLLLDTDTGAEEWREFRT
jgi:3',5'-cyclic AMP phosphodiesterase CpdA